MRRMLWLALIAVGGIVLLMLASIVLQQRAATAVGDLRAPVATLAEGLKHWDFEKVQAATEDPVILTDRYEKWFAGAHSNNPAQQRILRGLISSLETFPSIRFPGARPERVEVLYEAKDGQSHARMALGFVPKDGGWILKSARPAVASDDNTSVSPIEFHEGDNIAVASTVRKLFDALMTGRPEDLSAVMRMPDNATTARQAIDDLRGEVVPCRADRLEQMLPVVGKMPQGWMFLRLNIIAKVDGRPMGMDMVFEPNSSGIRLARFHCGLMSERAAPAPAPAPQEPAGNIPHLNAPKAPEGEGK